MRHLAPVALVVAGCSPGGPCAPETDLAAIEARYQAELVAACASFAPADPPTECPSYQEITDRARRAREEWAACQR
ncbi:MAG: hypothetical protein HYZ29_23310 [Myxococcales bacterium]|nr:hypothetical protein [Myxococcales bacterium]